MADKKKPAKKLSATKEKTPAWTIVQGKGCWIIEGRNRYHFETEDAAKKFLAELDS